MADKAKIVAVLTARPGKIAELRALLDAMVTASRAEPGALRYDLWQDASEPARFVLDELYVSPEAVVAHRASEHFQAYLGRIGDLAERTALTLEPITVA